MVASGRVARSLLVPDGDPNLKVGENEKLSSPADSLRSEFIRHPSSFILNFLPSVLGTRTAVAECLSGRRFYTDRGILTLDCRGCSRPHLHWTYTHVDHLVDVRSRLPNRHTQSRDTPRAVCRVQDRSARAYQ